MPKTKALPEASLTMPETEWAYMAGIIDSDGSIGMYSAKSQSKNLEAKNYYLRLSVVNTSDILMRWLRERFGGTLFTRKANERHAATHYWNVSQMNAGQIIRRCRPYIVAKTDQADLAIEYIDSFVAAYGSLGMSPQVRALRREYWLRMARLKGRASSISRSRRD